MDISINQEAMGVQNRIENQVFKLNKFDETDVKGNNNLYNSRKTDTENNSGSLFRDGYSSENLQVDPSLFSYSSFKKAMDLRTHNRMDDENRRTIFDDADYFAKNFFYKLLPITFEQVDETIIHTEHNYSLFSLNSESESDEDCSRMMDYTQIKEKNYKRRRTKFKEGSDEEIWDGNENAVDSNQNIPNQKEPPASEPETFSENSIQPLDLSTAPPVQEHKTDNYHCHLKEQPDVEEENLSSKLKCIQVTITRPDEKENYQPCDMFLNDIARLVPRLINNDCFEIDILDRTGDRHNDFRKHRLYYIIAESTWKLFQSTRERVILTNDHTLGPPVKKVEKGERPTFLVFDQVSLAKCLAEYCKEIGGCFEYTCVEEEKESEKEEEVKNRKRIELVKKAIEVDRKDETVVEGNPEETKTVGTITEKKPEEEWNLKSKEVIVKEVAPETDNHEFDDKDKSSDNAEKVDTKPEEAANKNNFTETIPEKFETEDTKAEERNTIETERFDGEINEVETNALGEKEIKIDAEGTSLNLYLKERKTKEKLMKKKNKVENKAMERKKIKVNARRMKRNKICAQEVEGEKTEIAVNSYETRIIAVSPSNLKTDWTDTKEMKEIEMKTDMENLKRSITKKPHESSTENEKMIEDTSRKTKEEEVRRKETKIFDGKIKSCEETAIKMTDKQSRKRRIEMNERKPIKTSKKFKKSMETVVKVPQEFEEETKMDKNAKGKTPEVKEARAKEMTRNEKCKKGGKETEMNRKNRKTPKKERKSTQRAKISEKLQGKIKKNGVEVEKAKNLPVKKRFKPESSLSQTVPQIKTRSKSTSESETSQKPNKEIRKPKNIMRKPAEVGTTETHQRRTRSGKEIEEKTQDVKLEEIGRGVRGRKRKMKEEERIVNERCLRSQGGKRK